MARQTERHGAIRLFLVNRNIQTKENPIMNIKKSFLNVTRPPVFGSSAGQTTGGIEMRTLRVPRLVFRPSARDRAPRQGFSLRGERGHSGRHRFFGRLACRALLAIAALVIGATLAPAQTVYVGNNLVVPNGLPDGVAKPLVILGEYNPNGPLSSASPSTTLPAGLVQDVKFYAQNYNFTLYALSFVSSGPGANQQTFKVVASQSFSGTNSAPGLQTSPVTGFMVNGGDLLAFAGVGPYYPQQPNDAPNSDATYYNPAGYSPPGGLGAEFTVGVNGDTNAAYQYIGDDFGNQGRSYAIGVDVAETNLFLPVYHISQNGATADQARYLADALSIPPNLLVQSNGLVGFIDPSNFMAVPTVPFTDPVVISNLLAETKQPAGAVPISFRAIDFGSLSNRPVLGTNAALNLASSALAAAGLTPQFGRPVIGHTVFTAFCTNDDGTVSSTHQYLDAQVNYQFTDAAGFPLIGPGAQAQLAFDSQGATTRFLYACRLLAPGPTVEVISPLEASNRVVHLLPPNARVNLQLVYWAPPFWPPTPPCYQCPPVNWIPNDILPFYAFNGTVTEINPITGAQQVDTTEVRLIPATDNIDSSPR